MRIRRFIYLSSAFALLILKGCSPLKQYGESTYAWALPEIEAFKQLDATTNYAPGSILFMGSSSIRLWDSLTEDMAPLPIIQRGYGGAHFRDLIFYVDTLLNEHDLRMVVCFVANDISQSKSDESTNKILNNYDYVVKRIRKKHPTIPILQLSITPTESRWHLWSQINALNKGLKSYCQSHDNMYFLETTSHFLNAAGQPKSELFRKDRLHLNKEGYALWNRLIKPEVERILAIQN
jgi:hypothetical protein